MRNEVSSELDGLVTAIYQAAGGVIPAGRVLERLARLTQSDKAFVGRFNTRRREGAIVSNFNLGPGAAEQYNQFFAPQNPWLASPSFFQAEGLAWRGSEIINDADLKRTNFYRLFMMPQAMLHTAHVVVRVQGPDILHIVLSRPPAAEPFDDAALDVGRLYVVHAREALEVQKAVETSRWMEAGFAEATNSLSVGLAVIQPPATVRFISDACRAMFEAAVSGAEEASVRTNSPNGNGNARPYTVRLPRLLADALAQRPIPSSCVLHSPNGHEGRPTVVDIHPYSIPSEFDGQPRIGYVLTCRGGGTTVEVDELSLREAFALTAAEARICAALAAGDNVESLACKLGISQLTARTHLKHIFGKTCTTRQPELMKLLMAMSRRKPDSPAALVATGSWNANVVHFKRDSQ